MRSPAHHIKVPAAETTVLAAPAYTRHSSRTAAVALAGANATAEEPEPIVWQGVRTSHRSTAPDASAAAPAGAAARRHRYLLLRVRVRCVIVMWLLNDKRTS